MASSDTTTMSLSRYAEDSRSLVAGAQALADERKHAEMQPLHLLAHALTAHAGVAQVFRRAVARFADLQAAVERALDGLPRTTEPAYLSMAMLDLLERAQREAERDRSREVQLAHLLNALSQEIRGAAGELLGAFGVAPGSLRPHLAELEAFPQAARPGHATPVEARDLVEEAKAGADPVIGRLTEIRRLLAILERRHKCHPLIVGEPGVGKRALVRGLARRIAGGNVPERLKHVQLVTLDEVTLVAGARMRSEVESRFQKLAATAERSGQVVWVIDGLEQLFGGGTQASGIGPLLKPVLERASIRVLGITTPEGLRRIKERQPDILRWFVELPLEEPDVDLSLEILRGVAGQIEAHHQLEITKGAIEASVRLAKRYLQDRFLPESALDLLDEAAAQERIDADGAPLDVEEARARAEALGLQVKSLAGTDDGASKELAERLQEEHARIEEHLRRRADGQVNQPERTATELSERHVADTLMRWTGIPVAKMLEAETDKLLKMEERLSERVVGQDPALKAVARAVRRGRVGLRDPKKPIGSLLFLGPSGVGKTELAKALAQFLFDDEHALTRLDMSEFMERHMAQRLIGAPPGYADSEQGGFLTEAVRRRPYSVLLFDEVEKAHQDVFNLLLQVLDDGQLTDGRGRRADFSNTVVIMTSNIGSGRILDTDAKLFERPEGVEALLEVIQEELGRFFRPEFLNRIDDVLIFQPLSRDVLDLIIEIELRRVNAMLVERGLTLELTPEAKQHLVDAGYEPALGARPLKRALLSELQDPLADALLRGSYPAGSTVRVVKADDGLDFSHEPPVTQDSEGVER